MPSPEALGKNGSFAAVRILAQDCAAFERFLDVASKQTGLERELIAAKLRGRWQPGYRWSIAGGLEAAKRSRSAVE